MIHWVPNFFSRSMRGNIGWSVQWLHPTPSLHEGGPDDTGHDFSSGAQETYAPPHDLVTMAPALGWFHLKTFKREGLTGHYYEFTLVILT